MADWIRSGFPEEHPSDMQTLEKDRGKKALVVSSTSEGMMMG